MPIYFNYEKMVLDLLLPCHLGYHHVTFVAAIASGIAAAASPATFAIPGEA